MGRDGRRGAERLRAVLPDADHGYLCWLSAQHRSGRFCGSAAGKRRVLRNDEEQAERERRACEGGRLLRPAGELGGFRLLDDGRAVQPLRVRHADGR